MFAVDDQDSFTEVARLREMVAEIKSNADVPVVIVGNKTDLEQRQVAKEMAECECIDWDTGNRTGLNLSQLTIAQLTLNARPRPTTT